MDIAQPQKILSYFKKQKLLLVLITVFGIIYNIGLLAGPYYEGKLVQSLDDIIKGSKVFNDMLFIVICYLLVTFVVQGCRYLKRLKVREFANNINKDMKQILYHNLINKSTLELQSGDVGSIITKAVSDVDDCVEGMRKFTTEVFDTGVALISYVVMLLIYDYKLALLCLIFPPITYYIAEKMKKVVQSLNEKKKQANSKLNSATLERVDNEIIYRLFSVKEQADKRYDAVLNDYSQKAISAGSKSVVLPPLYQAIAMLGVIFIIYFGSRNVKDGLWDIASFTTFLSCYSKLATKSSKAAKLFNSVQQAEVSWQRIKPLLNKIEDSEDNIISSVDELKVHDLSAYKDDGSLIYDGVSFSAKKGEIIGISGPVACGKTVLGKTFLNEKDYQGSILIDGKELREYSEKDKLISYLGHDLELLDASIKDNILLGKDDDVNKYLQYCSLDDEVSEKDNVVELSGGQRQRVALARSLAHKRAILVLDDPFSALDKKTESKVFENLSQSTKDNIVLLISHRLYLFEKVDKVLWIEDGKSYFSDHLTMLKENASYKMMFDKQMGGSDLDEK